MLDSVVYGIVYFAQSIGVGVVFLSAFTGVFITFILSLIIKNRVKSVKKTRCAVICILTFFCFLFIGLASFINDTSEEIKKGLTMILISFTILLSLPIIFITERKKIDLEASKSLIKTLDEKINTNSVVDKESALVDRKSERIICREAEKIDTKDDDLEVDFSHVKNVIDRLNYFNLNLSEKKQVNELNYLIKRVGEENDVASFRSEINEKLTGLLKIMSKYNI